MRVKIAGVAVAAALALAVSGCGSSDDKADDGAKGSEPGLVIWADDKRAPVLESFRSQFESELGVTIKIEAVSKDLQANFVTASQGDNAPDVVIGAHDWIGNLVQNGAIDPVQLTDAQKTGFNADALKAVTYNGQVYGAPYAVENLALIRNTELAPEAPSSIEDMVADAEKLKKDGKTEELLSLQVGDNGDAYHAYPLYASAGGYLFGQKDNGDYDPSDLGVGKPGSIAAFEKISELGKKGVLKTSIGSENSIPLFTEGKTAYLVSGPWALTDIKKAGTKYDITPIPGFEGMGKATPFLGVQSFFVASKGKHKTVAQEFVANYVTGEPLATALYNADPRPPALTASFDKVKTTDPDLAKFAEAGAGAPALPAIPEMSAIWDPFGKAESAIVGGADVKDTVEGAATTIGDAIKK
ncbi:sugar ABC transporter substrate-binding protein [Phytomonospora endophytica]|uniref:Arabinogalactan oligomer/maltooligosaccharide transport system substrate-binding protein n=1 Tax=Phytomonospora endophytica TaxID=714109 RepID=A0A841FRY4_9ACTN|nr:maltose ABC transporter substrate-binding protein [Phytomonospora endophytica]MBB6035309.1 arabinogalactan oligomer/maltooligosaccharide transport system substrate-binding protein [Phytomonospora endophytica]GIG63942.1 sugar ABC transporter substrate-binding protein [Phytomonospora endophytica]